jgi:hypothetical protein
VIAALPGAEKQKRLNERKELKRQLLDEVLKEAGKLAEAAERDMSKQLCTTCSVMASASAPLGAQAKWAEKHDDLVQSASRRTSMYNNTCRYFLMADKMAIN